MARNFNGSSDQIAISISSGLNAFHSQSLSVWVYTNTLATPGTIFTVEGASTSQFSLFMYGTPNAGKLGLFLSGGNVNLSTATLATNTWTHLVGVSDGSTITALYINGVLDSTGGASAGNGVTSPTIVGGIGYRAYTGVSGGFWSGNIADVCFWDGVLLSALEIAQLANGVRPSSIRPKSIVTLWPLDGLQSPEPDLSGNAYNGTLTGTAKAFGPPLDQSTPRWPLFFAFPAPATSFILMPQAIL
jgi:Concanavalin A-like lectin/glucanases superfamily